MMRLMKRILVTGSVAYDQLLTHDGSFLDGIDVTNLQELSINFLTPHFEKHHGGTAANIGWHLQLLNQDPLLVATVGTDGGEYKALLESRGIAMDHVEELSDAMTATAIIVTDSDSRQISFFHPGADAKGQWPDLSQQRDDIAYAIISPRNVMMMMQGARWCSEFAVPFLFDPGQATNALSPDELIRAIRLSSGLIVNAYEWTQVADKAHVSFDDVLRMTDFVVVTHGEDGLTIYGHDRTMVIPACKAEKVINPTGAGDALRAGFITGLAAGWTLEQCGRFGASVASFEVEYDGTLTDSLDINAVLGRAETTYGEMLPELP